jgi:ceramide glucosyltransferase
MTASFVLGLVALLGTIVTTVQALLTRRFRKRSQIADRRSQERADGRLRPCQPPTANRQLDRPRPCDPRSAICDPGFVSILKPVCGLDDELEQNLLSFTRLEGIHYEVIISAEEWDDPAVDVVRRIMRLHPEAPFRLIVDAGSRHGVVNRKVERLIAAARIATGDLFVISDSNVRVEPGDLARTIAAFADPRVGCVSNLFTGSGARSLGAVIESLHLLGFVVPGAVMAAAIHTPCVVGKSMALRRSVHDAIGGFERFRRVLAEDQAIGLAVKDAGYEVVLSPVVVRNVIVARSLKGAFARQVRWNKIRFSFSHRLYTGELLLNPLVFAAAAAILEPERLALFPLFVAAARCLQLALLSRATRAGMTWKQLAATPILDAMMLAAWFVPFFSNRITWRGYHARIGRGTEMIEKAA